MPVDLRAPPSPFGSVLGDKVFVTSREQGHARVPGMDISMA
jgi:hypothetical protein